MFTAMTSNPDSTHPEGAADRPTSTVGSFSSGGARQDSSGGSHSESAAGGAGGAGGPVPAMDARGAHGTASADDVAYLVAPPYSTSGTDDHPAWHELESEAATALSLDGVAAKRTDSAATIEGWLLGLEARTTAFSTGIEIGRGWEWEAVIVGPPETHYEGLAYRLELFVPADYPESPPTPRWRSLVIHSQLQEDGTLVLPETYAKLLDWKGLRRQWSAASAAAAASGTDPPAFLGLLAVASLSYQMLTSWLEETPQPLPEHLALKYWRDHDPGEGSHGHGHSHGGGHDRGHGDHEHRHMVPFAYKKLMELDGAERRAALAKLEERLMLVQREQSMRVMATHVFCVRSYAPHYKHEELFDDEVGWRDEWFTPSFLEAVRSGTADSIRRIMTEVSPGVFQCDMMQPEYCAMLAEEVQAFEDTDLPHLRPNSMNNYGVIVNHIGMKWMMDILVEKYMRRIGAVLFPDDGGATLDSQHSFVVKYAEDEDRSLDMHTDDSEVTLNLSLVDTFTGAGLTFCGRADSTSHRKSSLVYEHRVGRAVFHAGVHRHGANRLESGVRLNLIVWARSAQFRTAPGFAERRRRRGDEAAPDIVCLSRKHDEDYDEIMGRAGSIAT